jgi:hypothetical protein
VSRQRRAATARQQLETIIDAGRELFDPERIRPRYVSVYVTAPSLDVAHKIGRALVEERLAACVNIIPGMHSWRGQSRRASRISIGSGREQLRREVVSSFAGQGCLLTVTIA